MIKRTIGCLFIAFSMTLLPATFSSAATDQNQKQTPSDQAPQPEPKDLDGWLNAIEKKAKSIKSLQANLRYERFNDLLDSREIRIGTLFYQAEPTKKFAANFRLKISPNGRGDKIDQSWIFDGRWLAEKNNSTKFFKRYEVAPPPKEGEEKKAEKDVLELGDGPFAIPIDFNKETLLKDFQVTLIENKEVVLKNTVHLRLIPRDKKKIEETSFDLWYNKKTLLPVMVQSVNEEQETRSIFKLTKPKLNIKIDQKIFDTSIPKGKEWTVDEQRAK